MLTRSVVESSIVRIAPQDRVRLLASLRVQGKLTSGKRSPVLLLGDGGVACHELGEVDGVCAEAPLPCITVRDQRYLLDGIGGIASMLKYWGVSPAVWLPLGDGEPSRLQRKLLIKENIRSVPFAATKLQVTRYTRRFFAGGHQLAHVESVESIAPVSAREARSSVIKVGNALADAELFCVVDKGRSGLTSELLARLIRCAARDRRQVLYEPRAANALFGCGCDVVKINHNQIRDWFGLGMDTERDALTCAEMVLRKTGAKSVICTRGERGIVVRARTAQGTRSYLFTPQPRKLFDLISAGDVVTASLAFCLVRGSSLVEATCFAITAAELSLDRRHDKHLDIESILNFQ